MSPTQTCFAVYGTASNHVDRETCARHPELHREVASITHRELLHPSLDFQQIPGITLLQGTSFICKRGHARDAPTCCSFLENPRVFCRTGGLFFVVAEGIPREGRKQFRGAGATNALSYKRKMLVGNLCDFVRKVRVIAISGRDPDWYSGIQCTALLQIPGPSYHSRIPPVDVCFLWGGSRNSDG